MNGRLSGVHLARPIGLSWAGLHTPFKKYREQRFALFVMASAFGSGLLFGSPIQFAGDPDVAIRAFGGSFMELRTILIVNLTTATLIGIGALTGGLLSTLVAILLGNYLGIQTAVLTAAHGSVMDMVLVTGPHGVLEMAGFVAALAAGLVPLGVWIEHVLDGRVDEGRLRTESLRPALGRFARHMAVAYSLIVVAGFVEVHNAFGV